MKTRRQRFLRLQLGVLAGLCAAITSPSLPVTLIGVAVALVATTLALITITPSRTRRKLARRLAPFRCRTCAKRHTNPLTHKCVIRRRAARVHR